MKIRAFEFLSDGEWDKGVAVQCHFLLQVFWVKGYLCCGLCAYISVGITSITYGSLCDSSSCFSQTTKMPLQLPSYLKIYKSKSPANYSEP